MNIVWKDDEHFGDPAVVGQAFHHGVRYAVKLVKSDMDGSWVSNYVASRRGGGVPSLCNLFIDEDTLAAAKQRFEEWVRDQVSD